VIRFGDIIEYGSAFLIIAVSLLLLFPYVYFSKNSFATRINYAKKVFSLAFLIIMVTVGFSLIIGGNSTLGISLILFGFIGALSIGILIKIFEVVYK
jgi:branched-subunit amino acid transport protein AzlD